MTVFEIKVYFDPICGWCYIGHKNLHQAITLFQKTYPGGSSDDFHIKYLPYYRDRTLPEKGIALEDQLKKSMSDEDMEKLKAHVQRVGRSNGINFTFDTTIGHSRDAQRLVYLANLDSDSDVQKAFIEQMYFRWHEMGGDITSHEFLFECATTAGLQEELVQEVLRSGRYSAEVNELDAAARAAGISCVPTFLIDGKKIEGAEDVTAFFEVFVDAKE